MRLHRVRYCITDEYGTRQSGEEMLRGNLLYLLPLLGTWRQVLKCNKLWNVIDKECLVKDCKITENMHSESVEIDSAKAQEPSCYLTHVDSFTKSDWNCVQKIEFEGAFDKTMLSQDHGIFRVLVNWIAPGAFARPKRIDSTISYFHLDPKITTFKKNQVWNYSFDIVECTGWLPNTKSIKYELETPVFIL